MTSVDNNETSARVERLLGIMQALRHPETGCPWDLKQDFKSIVPHTLEEAYEVADTIERDDMPALKDELGDLLFQVVFYSQLAQELGLFGFADVVESLNDKLTRRHPHVFSTPSNTSEDEVNQAWEEQKKRERNDKANDEHRSASVLDDVPVGLPALSRAAKLQKRASREGFDWPDITGATEKLHEELDELANAQGHDEQQHELGDVLFSVVNLSRFMKIDSEKALRYASARFSNRFQWIETKLNESGTEIRNCSPETLEALWDQAKRATA